MRHLPQPGREFSWECNREYLPVTLGTDSGRLLTYCLIYMTLLSSPNEISKVISSVSILTPPAIAGSLAVIGILVLVTMPVQREQATPSADYRLHQLCRVLNIGILPLMLCYF